MGESQLVESLRKDLAKGGVLVIAGAGISLQATRGQKCAGWTGLILDGIDYCVETDRFPERIATALRERITTEGIGARLDVADFVTSHLGAPDGGEFRRWLRQSIGGLRLIDPEIIDAIHDLKAVIATTNIDTLLSQGRGLETVPWTDGAAAMEILRGDRKGILHLYGCYDRPESVILGTTSYMQHKASAVAQAVQQIAAVSRTLLFIGCGDGLADPNLAALFAWNRDILGATIYRHYCLCRKCDREWMQSLNADGRLFFIEYGNRYSDLVPFLHELPKRSSAAMGSETMILEESMEEEEQEDGIDVGVIVALREEFRELHALLPPTTVEKDLSTGTSDYLFTHSMDDGIPYRCAATFVGTMGPTEASLATERFLNRRQPTTIVMLGIAAGISDDVKLGDVVVAQHVGRYLDRAKIINGAKSFEIKPGGDSFPCSMDLVRATLDLEFAHGAQFQTWSQDGTADLSALVAEKSRELLLSEGLINAGPRFVEGSVASGPVVAASSQFIKWVKSTNRNYLALEMEGGAMLAAVYSRADPARSLMLRGISDFGDQRKKKLDAVGKGGLRRYAMRNAAKMLWRLLDAGVLPQGHGPTKKSTATALRTRRDPRLAARGVLDDGLAIWKEKLSYLRQQEAIRSDPAQLFTLRKQIEEAERRVASLER